MNHYICWGLMHKLSFLSKKKNVSEEMSAFVWMSFSAINKSN